MTDTWHEKYFQLVELVGQWSDDPDRKVGCVIVGADNGIRAIGYNGLPRGVASKPETRLRREGGAKYAWLEHAERNAVYAAARSGISLAQSRMYLTWFPCDDCARAIIQAGVVELVTRSADVDDPNWGERLKVAKTMLEEAGVKVVVVPR